ncbi:MAG: amidohydrolase family protein [Deltaproteobacteria bacterium]|nr:amidohydrolase family protein [Deltaproteobacteria bacterium]
MNRKRVISILSEIKEIKIATGLKIIDTHVHPLDVMGVIHFAEVDNALVQADCLSPGILERLNYGTVAKLLSKLAESLFPSQVNAVIRSSCERVNEASILNEMDTALVDDAVLLPIEPWLSLKVIKDRFYSSRFIPLTSIDIHNVSLDKIDRILKNSIFNYRVKGIKLHPNLQNFKPRPKDNSEDIAEKLDAIYRFAEKENLYLLFHGGISLYSNYINPRYPQNIQRSKDNALLKSFCDNNGVSDIFKNYRAQIVIAHLGHYEIANPDYKLIKKIVSKYDQVYFDTAGVATSLIKKSLDSVPSSKILFGSDAIYNRMAYNVAFTYQAIKETSNKEKKDDIVFNIFQNNFFRITGNTS